MTSINEAQDIAAALSKHPDYLSGCDEQGNFVEGLYHPSCRHSVYFLPGDCFGSWAYREFARRLHERKANVTLFNYPAGCCRGNSQPGNADYLRSFETTLAYVQHNFPSARRDPADTSFLGFSRGSLILQMYLQQRSLPGKILLLAPVLGKPKALDMAKDLALVVEILCKSLVGDQIKLSFRQFSNRFFSPRLSAREKARYFDCSQPIPKRVLFDSPAIDYQRLSSQTMSVVLFRQDGAVNYARQLQIIAHLRKKLKLKIKVLALDGYHCDVVSDPARVINEVLTGELGLNAP